MKLSLALFFAATLVASAQSIEVPHKLRFADMTLIIRDDARKEIQKDVDAFTRYPKSFNAKVERARTYFPIIEKIFAEEKVPDDFKFLVIQESALIADAVSTSNAVGYWQFKDFTAIEMGLRVDRQVDERMNIFASTRAAARYIKKNNTFFNNWLFALQAYQMGAGGVMRSEKNTRSGEKQMDITSNTYWYVKKYLAHKIAYEGFTGGTAELQIVPYETANGKRTLDEIARELNADQEQVKVYNKWLKSNRIPDDRNYAVMIPVKGDASGLKLPEPVVASATVGLHDNSTKAATVTTVQQRTKINGISAIRAADRETPAKLAERAGVELSSFLQWNDISISDKLDPGNYYLLGKKRNRAETDYHKVTQGETLWIISQRYGVKMKKLKRYNRLSGEEIRPGTTLWLSSRKPREGGDEPPRKAVEVNHNETFAWEVTTASTEKPEPAQEMKVPQETVVVAPAEGPSPAASADTLRNRVATSNRDSVLARTDTVRQVAPVSVEVVTIPSDSIANADLKSQVVVNPESHIVQPKETLYAIARQYNVSVMDLVSWNDLDLQHGIKPGQVIKLRPAQEANNASGAEEDSPMTLVHEVKATDTLYSIARKYGVTIKDVMEWNNKKDFNLAVGEKLRIVKK